MILKDFVREYINHNSLVRLVYKIPGGSKLVLDSWDDVDMSWQVVKGEGRFRSYINHQVIYITDISVRGNYSEAINIVIEEIPLDILRELKLKELGI
jgi:hypothetical protein